MIKSMTGFGKSSITFNRKVISIEIRSLNSKNLDLFFKVPSLYREKESDIRMLVSDRLKRGKVSIIIQIESAGESSARINTATVKDYIEQLRQIEPADNYLEIAMRLPDAVQNMEENTLPADEWTELRKGIINTLDKIDDFRIKEGAVLEKDFAQRIELIREGLGKIRELNPDRINAVKTRLRKAIDDLKAEVDENRYEQELIYYLERLDITEEQVRLDNHLNHFMEVLTAGVSQGKKLGFITQEIGREINTIGSKANHAPTQMLVVSMKDELEKIKEQLLNIL